MLPGLYDFQAFHCRVRTVFTNTVPVDAYRGAGRPEAPMWSSALVDAARKLGMTPDAIRRKNFISAEGDALQDRDRQDLTISVTSPRIEARDGDRQRKEFSRRAKAAKKGRRGAGIGMACYVEVCGTMGEETANVALDRTAT
jgi:carbon-monoxide dehydrogenase large subunit